jgi:hypothetical protein
MSTDATLTKRQKNRILTLVNEYGPPPSEFCWSEIEQGHPATGYYVVSVLTHMSTGYSCIFGAHDITISPGWERKVQHFRHEDNFERIEKLCSKWLILVEAEVEAPDLWATIGQERALSTAASTTLDNRPFTVAEQGLIAAKLDEIRAYLLQDQQFAAEEAEFVKRQVKYFKESSTRMGRKDWLNLLLGGLVSLAIGLALDPEKARGLLRLAGAVFQSLWGTGHNLLP